MVAHPPSFHPAKTLASTGWTGTSRGCSVFTAFSARALVLYETRPPDGRADGSSDRTPPAETRRLPEAQPAEEEQGIDDPSICGDALVGEDLLDLCAREDRAGAPRWVLIDLLRQLALFHLHGARLDELVGDGVLEHRVQHPVDVPHRARRQLIHPASRAPPQPADKVADVPWSNARERQFAEGFVDVLQPPFVRPDVGEPADAPSIREHHSRRPAGWDRLLADTADPSVR
jgi:hypothetical protein